MVYMIIMALCMSANLYSSCAADYTVDCVVFSYDRPLQLEGFLHSLNHYCLGLGSQSVIVRCSNSAFSAAYKTLEKQYPNVRFIYQTMNPNSFYTDTLYEVLRGPSDYIMFAVDDIIVTNVINCIECTNALRASKAHGFFLRLGQEKTYSLIPNIYSQPPLKSLSKNIMSWRFRGAHGDWAGFYSVDMSIFPKATLVPLLQKIQFHSPNSLEYELHQPAFDLSQESLCFNNAKVINFSLNLVRGGAWGKSAELPSYYLLGLFNQGKRIDIKALHNYQSCSCHVTDLPLIR